jgi:hypothetical protein
MASPTTRRRRVVLWLTVALWGLVLVAAGWWLTGFLRDRAETNRTTTRYDPPVWAGQSVIPACSGGFYARHDKTIVLTLSAHCLEPGTTLRGGDGELLGTLGPRAQLSDCPAGRFCAPSDFLTLAVAANRVPWGHLNIVDMGAGGYRVLAPGTKPLACSDVGVSDPVEIDGRERYRTGKVLSLGPYEYATDTMFPCMAIADIQVFTGDSGGAVLVRGQPAGVIARQISGLLGFTPLAEGLENLGLTLCTTPDCDLTPESAVQPSD